MSQVDMTLEKKTATHRVTAVGARVRKGELWSGGAKMWSGFIGGKG